jgi:glycosyltransferase involved in cell wall biosynthesis
MKVCYFGTYRAEYSRNRIMIEGLRQNGVSVVECNEQLWEGIDDRIQSVTGGWARPKFWMRLWRVYIKLCRRYLSLDAHDFVVVGYPGQLDVFIARILSWIRRKPLVWDIFMSIYLISLERGLGKSKGTTLLGVLERAACKLPDRLILDTQDYVDWFHSTHRIDPERFRLVPTGADNRIYHPVKNNEGKPVSFKVIYFGTYIPNHHVETIIEAARILNTIPNIQFLCVGAGPDLPRSKELAAQYRLGNLEFVDWVEESKLVELIADSQAVLGAFGDTPQSLMTIQNKIYTGMAMARPVISGDSPAVRAELVDKKQIFLCARKNPAALAEAILTLANDPDLCETIGNEGYLLFIRRFSIEKIGELFYQHLQEIAPL